MPRPIFCAECRVASVAFERGWRGYRTDDEYEPTVVVILCPECAERELGAPRRKTSNENEP
jgi:hypothetical protein